MQEAHRTRGIVTVDTNWSRSVGPARRSEFLAWLILLQNPRRIQLDCLGVRFQRVAIVRGISIMISQTEMHDHYDNNINKQNL